MNEKTHETRQISNETEGTHHIDEQLFELQRIEGLGPPKKVVLSDLPKPVRYFGIFVIACAVLMGAIGIILTIFD